MENYLSQKSVFQLNIHKCFGRLRIKAQETENNQPVYKLNKEGYSLCIHLDQLATTNEQPHWLLVLQNSKHVGRLKSNRYYSLEFLYQLPETFIIQSNNNHILKFPSQPALCIGHRSHLYPEFSSVQAPPARKLLP